MKNETILIDADLDERYEFAAWINENTQHRAEVSDCSDVYLIQSDDVNALSNDLWERYCNA